MDRASRGLVAEVAVRLTFGDGSSSLRDTYFVHGGGEWLHRFGDEETDLFMPGTPFEEFVAASGGEATASGGGSTLPGPVDPGAVEEAAEDYYRAAGVGDWGYTYEHLDSQTRSAFTREEWFEKNQWLADQGEAVYHVESVEEPDEASPEPLAEVTVRLTFEDGSSSVRGTFFVLEDGEWLHRFSQEEYELFMPGTPFDEFVEAHQQ